MEEKKNKNKGLIVVIILLIVLVLGLGGYIVYDKVLKVEEPVKTEQPKEEVVEKPDFYDVSELVKNNYIEKIETTETDYIKIVDGKVLVKSVYYEDFKEAKGIDETPKYVSGMGLCSDCQALGFIVLTEEGNVYYAEDDFNTQSVSDFKKMNSEKVSNIYKTNLYQQNRFYAEVSTGLLRVDKDGMNSSNTFESDFKYVDYVFKPNTGKSIVFMLDKEGNLYNFDETPIKYNGNSILASEVFAKRDGQSVTYYVITKDSKVYTIFNDEVKLYTDKEFSSYDIIGTNSEDGSSDIKITYQDGSDETISDIVATSTMYKRTN